MTPTRCARRPFEPSRPRPANRSTDGSCGRRTRLPATTSHAGGHVFIDLADATGSRFQAAAFEPTRAFRDAVRALRPGDKVAAVGAWRDGTVHLEKLRVDALARTMVKLQNPACPSCGKRMKSKGEEAGFRCRACGTAAPAGAGEWMDEARDVAVGWHEVPVIARRHLHRPVAWDEA